jgi:hypothetical protein
VGLSGPPIMIEAAAAEVTAAAAGGVQLSGAVWRLLPPWPPPSLVAPGGLGLRSESLSAPAARRAAGPRELDHGRAQTRPAGGLN